MKVLHITPWYEPAWKSGGIAVASSNLCRALVCQGVDVTVCTTTSSGGNGNLDVVPGSEYDIRRVKVRYFSPNRVGYKLYSRSLSNFCKNNISQYDIVHIHGTRHIPGLSAYKYIRKYGIPYVVTPHASLMDCWIKEIGGQIIKDIYIKLFDSRIIENASAINFLSKQEQVSTSSKYKIKSDVYIVPNGIDTSLYANATEKTTLRKDLDIPVNSLVLLSVGRIHPQKNQCLALDCLNLLISQGIKDIYYIIIGSEYDYQYSKKLYENITKCDGFVKHIDYVSNDQMPKWYYAADLLLLPSLVEGVSMTLIESLASGLPAIVSPNVANSSDIIDYNAGYVVEPNAVGISNLLKEIVDDRSLLKILSLNALKLSKSKYAIQYAAQETVKMYKSILSRHD